MEKHEDYIDQFLFSHLSDASMDEDGIDWNAFRDKQKKRRLAFWLFSLLCILLIGGLSLLIYNYEWKKEVIKKVSQPVSKSKTIEPKDKNTISEKPFIKIPDKKSTRNTSEEIAIKSNPELLEQALLKPENPVTKENPFTETEVENPAFALTEIRFTEKEIPDLFDYIKPIYTAEKVPQNKLMNPVLNIKKLNLYWEVQAGPSLNVPNFKVTPAGKAFIHKDYESIRKLSETAVSGYNFQLALGRSLKRWNYSLGFGFSNFILLGNYNFSYSERPVIDMDGKIKDYLGQNSANIQFTSKHTISFIEIPLSIQYMFIDKPKFSAGLRLGYVNQFLSKINGQLPNAVFLDERENMSTENFKTRTSSFQGGIQFLYKLNENSSLILMPEYRRGLGFNQVQSYYKTDFNYFGLNLNYRMGL